MVPNSRRILQNAYNFMSRKWFTKDIPSAVNAVVTAYGARSEVNGGGTNGAEGASVAAGICAFTMDAIDATLNGKLKSAVGPIADKDLLDKAAATAIETPLFTDGATAAALLLANDEVAYCTLIISNSDGAGGVVDTDGGDPVFHIIVSGTAATYDDQTGHASSEDIQAALRASSSLHEGVTGWAHVLRFRFTNPGGVPEINGIELNRNNHRGA